jgi:hypothetical protein
MAKGVQGMMDFTVPGGGSSLTVSVAEGIGIVEAKSDLGSINRMLQRRKTRIYGRIWTHLWYKL